MITALAGRFGNLWQRLGARGEAGAVWRDLETRYSEPQRHYHNLAHLEHCFAEFDPARHLARQPDAIGAAIFFHDAVYDPRAKDNEQRSADLAREVLAAAKVAGAFADQVADLILDTRHMTPATSADGQLLVDVDLAILGQPRERFAEYERQIRAEYDWVPDADFRAGRAAILQRFLRQPTIYLTECFRKRFEEAARENLSWSVARLVTH